MLATIEIVDSITCPSLSWTPCCFHFLCIEWPFYFCLDKTERNGNIVYCGCYCLQLCGTTEVLKRWPSKCLSETLDLQHQKPRRISDIAGGSALGAPAPLSLSSDTHYSWQLHSTASAPPRLLKSTGFVFLAKNLWKGSIANSLLFSKQVCWASNLMFQWRVWSKFGVRILSTPLPEILPTLLGMFR